MRRHRGTGETREIIREILSRNPGLSAAAIAREIGCHPSNVQRLLHKIRQGPVQSPSEHTEFTVHNPPSPELSAEELIELRRRQFAQKKEYEDERRLIRIEMHSDDPIGILHLGDPHVDDDGCDWDLLLRDIDLIRTTPGMYCSNVGDTTNNWVGRLAKLYGQQSTSSKQAWILAEWFIRRLEGRWLYMVGGNHDAWSGDADPLQWIAGSVRALYEPSEARIGLSFPNGKIVRINCRHDFSGHSQWNPTHGPMKALQLGVRDHIAICGHKHKSGYSPLVDPEDAAGDRIVCHAIQVASYKRYDRYARDKGFRDQSISPCVVTVINPKADHPADLVQVFWNPPTAVRHLKMLRGES